MDKIDDIPDLKKYFDKIQEFKFFDTTNSRVARQCRECVERKNAASGLVFNIEFPDERCFKDDDSLSESKLMAYIYLRGFDFLILPSKTCQIAVYFNDFCYNRRLLIIADLKNGLINCRTTIVCTFFECHDSLEFYCGATKKSWSQKMSLDDKEKLFDSNFKIDQVFDKNYLFFETSPLQGFPEET